jgi:predicted amidohydrolase
MKNPVIALAQIKYYDINSTHNLVKIKKYINMAKRKGADIICFPEFVIHKTKVLHLKHRFVNEIREECKKNSIWCIITHDFNFGGKEYNTALLIDRKGKIQGDYRKINLFGDTVRKGSKIKVFKTDFAKIGIAICWDVAFPSLFKEMKKKGAQIIFCPSQWWYEIKAHKEKHNEREVQLLRSMIMTRAFENVLYVAMCNPVMDSKFQVSYTGISSPHKILDEAVNREALIVSEINLKDIKKLEKIYS